MLNHTFLGASGDRRMFATFPVPSFMLHTPKVHTAPNSLNAYLNLNAYELHRQIHSHNYKPTFVCITAAEEGAVFEVIYILFSCRTRNIFDSKKTSPKSESSLKTSLILKLDSGIYLSFIVLLQPWQQTAHGKGFLPC